MNSKSIAPIFYELFPDKEFHYDSKLKYSAKFSDYNANIKLYKNNLTINLSKKWKGVNKEIVKGLVQSLLIRMFCKGMKKDKVHAINHSMNIDLYNNFIKSLHLSIPKTNIDFDLKRSFDRINNQYFYDQIEIPNLCWGHFSKRKFATYDYQTDTIKFSKILQNQNIELIDYVMYHELLHKKLKYKSTTSRNVFHSAEFKKMEKAYPNHEELEMQLRKLALRFRKKKLLFGLFKYK